MNKIFFLILLILISINFPLKSHDDILTSEGKDFWFTFLPNFHNKDNQYSTDSLYIYVTSKVPTKGKIVWFEDRPDTIHKEINFEITTSNQILKFPFHYWFIELRGYVNPNVSPPISIDNSEKISKKSFHITSEENCSVYALNYAQLTADAFIVLPVTSLGKEYYVLAWNNDQDTPSQFVVVATEDFTEITIIPSDSTRYKQKDTQNILLNKGEVYLVQANTKNPRGDLSGSQIISNKDIAVFSGQQRVGIPGGYSSTSRDVLLTQLMPIKSWGRNAIITPFAKYLSTGTVSWDTLSGYYRVVAAFDETEIRENGISVATINKGEKYHGILKPAIISSNNPILVASYSISSGNSYNNGYGDPTIIVASPIEQYKLDYCVTNIQCKINDENMFTTQYLTIITPTWGIDSILLDGAFINYSQFISIDNTGYSYSNIETTDGNHLINSPYPISVIVYGYGKAISYGYLGGMTFFDLQDEKIKIHTNECISSGTLTYIESFNSVIDTYKILDTYNCEISQILKETWKLILKIDKINNNDIAYFTIKLSDKWGWDTTYTDTFKINGISHNVPEVDEKFSINFGKQTIGTIEKYIFSLNNIGDFPITITEKNFYMYENKIFTIGKTIFPFTLNPNDSANIEIYYSPISSINSNKKDNVLRIDKDTLIIKTICNEYIIYLSGYPVSHTNELIYGQCSMPIRLVGGAMDSTLWTAKIFPNPIDNKEIVYSFYIESDNYFEIGIYDLNGNQINNAPLPVVEIYLLEGMYEVPLSINDLPAGTYYIGIKSSSMQQYTKFIITK